MKIILLQDVAGVGKKYEVKEVKDGYARNFLLPQRMAIAATVEALKKIQQEKEILEKQKAAHLSRLKEVAERIKNKVLEFNLKTGSKGEIFGSVTINDIKKSLGEEFCDVKINPNKSFKTLGEHIITIDLGEGIKTDLKLIIKSIPKLS